MTNSLLKIWLVDDHKLFRDGLKTLLSRIDGVDVVYEASDGREFLAKLKEERPDIVFMDISMPNIDGIAATKEALIISPDINIVILSMYNERDYYIKLVDLGVKGFLLKSCDFLEIEQAIKSVRQGDLYFSQELLSMGNTLSSDSRLQEYEELSERELEILTKICEGASNQEIADQLFISKRTVEKHRANLMLKTNCNNTASLVVFAVKKGLYSI